MTLQVFNENPEPGFSYATSQSTETSLQWESNAWKDPLGLREGLPAEQPLPWHARGREGWLAPAR